jgi:hypothetical protein
LVPSVLQRSTLAWLEAAVFLPAVHNAPRTSNE